MADEIRIELYDSDTGKSLEVAHVEDVSAFQKNIERALLIYTEAKAGPIVQLRRYDKYGGEGRIHYFYREPGGQTMLNEDAMRFGFQRGDLLALVERYAPTPGAPQ